MSESQADAAEEIEPVEPVAESEPLAAEFEPASYEEWEKLVRSKAKDAEAPLTTELEDGIELRWLYTADDALAPDPGGLPGADPFVRGTRLGAPWAIRQENGAPDRSTANAQILEDLEGGATEILLRVDPDGEHGIPVSSVEELEETLEGVLLDLAPIALDAGARSQDTALLLVELWRRSEHPADELRGSLRLDPIGAHARTGATDTDALTAAIKTAVETAATVREEFPGVQVLAVDTGPYADAGAGAPFELALALSAGIAYLRAGEEAGVEPAQLAAALEFTLIADADQFTGIAKLRAARRLWSTVLEHCGVEAADRRSPLYARTSRRMASSLDPWVNLLRSTSASFAAGVAGADGVTVLPFDEAVGEAFGEPGPLGRRMARNTQLLLMEESSLHRVADPAGGSWYVESLTDQLGRAAWSELQELERDGGIVDALASGRLAERLAEATARRQDEIARRRRILTGVNTFPLLGDDGLERPEPEPRPESEPGPTSGSGPDDGAAPAASPSLQAGEAGQALLPVRDAAAFEHLRARAAALAEPEVLLACMGPLSAHVNIAQWAKSFFEAGGVATVSSGGQPDDDAHVSFMNEKALRIVAVCPGRGVELDEQAALVAALRDAGAEAVYLAGASETQAEEAGADVGVKDGVDMVAVLGELLDRFESEEARR